jgi:SAM-dependent methyltransferase
MRESIKEFVKICSKILLIDEPIYEFGAMQVPGQEGFADLRPFFDMREYYGADIREGCGVDLILDLHDINLKSGTVGTVLIMDTLEHVEYPRKAIEESYRILNQKGILIISSVMNFPIHDYPKDYWRFTPEAFRSLLRDFSSVVVEYAGEDIFPHTVVGIGFKEKMSEGVLDKVKGELTCWRENFYNDR